MRSKLIKKFKWELITAIVLSVITVLYKMASKNSWECKDIIKDEWSEIVFFSFFVPSIFLIIHLFRMLSNQLNNPLSVIQSELIKKEAHNFGKNNMDLIANTLSTMISDDTSSILWEFKNLDLGEFEIDCLRCSPGAKPHECGKINKIVKIQRRRRITQIANCLILSGGEYYATETKKPSSLIELDKSYYENQKKCLKSKSVKKACRLLILKRDILIDELATKREQLEQYVEYNIENSKDEQKITFKIISFTNDIGDVFQLDNINKQFYDFVVSKKNKQITVFAQNRNNYLTSYDSTHENNSDTAQSFYKAFDRLFSHKSEIGAISYSKEINSFVDVETFINSI